MNVASRFESGNLSTRESRNLPEGTLSEDQTSWATLSGFTGGQFMTGRGVLPESTGPSPLLLPATATSTT